ncbi:hypothetical protein N7499_001996 [Penicillium canescens]|nr:hypothetical protein N7499_001996 [Penicillium canescens]KAJ6165610.1 hypothetical protein N7485_008854 [Penicillium canescens]
MAEVIGVVSGAITFATVVAQVTESIITIKDCWCQFPEIQEDQSQDAFAFALKGNRHAVQSLEFGSEAAANLQELSNELLRDMNSSHRLRKSYAAAKMVMHRGKLERHMARLRNAIQLLSLSQQCYTRLVQDKKSTATFKPKVYQQVLVASLFTVLAEFKKALEVYSERLHHGWQWVFRTYNVIPSTSKASPFDPTGRFGYTLLHYATLGPRKEQMLKFLLDQGVDSSIVGNHPNLETPLNMLVFCGALGLGKGQPLLPCLHLLLRYRKETSYEDTLEETIRGVLSRFRGSSEEFKFL